MIFKVYSLLSAAGFPVISFKLPSLAFWWGVRNGGKEISLWVPWQGDLAVVFGKCVGNSHRVALKLQSV